MLFKRLKLLTILFFVLAPLGFAATYNTAIPMRAGPVSHYGALGTSGSKIVSISNGKQAMLRGLSFFWSDPTGLAYYTEDVVEYVAATLKADVLRFAMGTGYYDNKGGASSPILNAYATNPASLKQTLDRMVAAAIENDIYLIIDWHSHRAEQELSIAKEFFSYAAERYKGIPNIIWEVYNEPVYTSWGEVKSYSENIISIIRAHSPNLALVGTTNWSQNPQEGANSPVNQPNVAYVLHFYAGTHFVESFRGKITQTLNAGYPVFISEWGTTEASGSGGVNSSESQKWLSFMDSNNISNCNWSIRHAMGVNGENEASALFSGSTTLNNKAALATATYSTSGNIVKNYLQTKGRAWADSLIAGKTSGSCHFKSIEEKETVGTITGKANSGCTYTSSDDAVATIAGGTITIKKAGLAVFTGNDGSQSVLVATKVPSQTYNIKELVCRINGSCNSGNLGSYSSSGNKNEQKTNSTTIEGSNVSVTSSNPSVISVTKTKCTGSDCIGSSKDQEVWVYQFKSLGRSEIRITVPATAQYGALDTTVSMAYMKNNQSLDGVFKNMTVAPGSVTDMLPLTTRYEDAPVTYTFSNEGYASIQGTNLVAGNENVIINITANAPATTNYEALGTANDGTVNGVTRTIIIGTGELDATIPLQLIQVSNLLTPFKLGSSPEGLRLSLSRGSMIEIQFLDVHGREVSPGLKEKKNAGEHWVSLSHLQSGHYLIRVKQGAYSKTIPFIKK